MDWGDLEDWIIAAITVALVIVWVVGPYRIWW
jgi:hypothetical protein